MSALKHYRMGVQNFSEKNYDAAIRDFTTFLDIFHNDPQSDVDPAWAAHAYNKLGDIYQAKNMFQEAIQNFGKVLELMPEMSLASRYERETQFNGELAAVIFKIDSARIEFGKVYTKNGNDYKDKNDFDNAIASYLQAIKLDPKFIHSYVALVNLVEAYISRGDGRLKNGNHDKAAEDYNNAMKLDEIFAERPRQELLSLKIASASKPSPVKIDSKDIIKNKEMGSGVSSKVYIGKWNDMIVAIKEMKWGSDNIEFFENEKKILLALMHLNSPYIVKLYGFIEDNISKALVVSYLPGGDVADYLIQHMYPDMLLLHRISLDVAYGLKHSHDSGIIHCDIKLENVMLDENMRAKLVDYGFAIFKDDKTRHELRGTPSYIAPELIIESIPPYSEKSDIYAYGIMLYMLYTRTNAYSDSINDMMLMNLVAFHNNRPSLEVNPKDVHKVIQSCWFFKPASRPSANELVTSFENIMNPNRI